MRPWSSIVPMLVVAGLICPLQAQSKPEAEAMVKKAIAFAKAQGMDKALAEVSKPGGSFTKGELYVFVYDLNGVVKAHGQNPKLVGKDMLLMKDPDGVFYVKERIELANAKGKGWQNYKETNPATKKIEPKRAYIEKEDNYIFGSGFYRK